MTAQHGTPIPVEPKTWGEYMDGFPTNPITKKMKAAIEHDKRAAEQSERAHPLKDYYTQPMRRSINPTA